MYNESFVSALKEALNGLKTVHQVGEEWVSYVGDIPTGGVPYCGQEVNRETYSALWEYANAKGLVKSESEWQSLYNAQGGNVAFYSSGNGSSTFRMPRLVGYVRGASSQSESGSYVNEGLPNITSSATISLMTGYGTTGFVSNTGAITLRTSDSNYWYNNASSANKPYVMMSFDASESNSIYGNSSHVTPETSVVLYGVYAFGEVTNVSSIDIGTVASSFAALESNVGSKLTSLESNVDSKLNGVVRSVNGTNADASGNVEIGGGWKQVTSVVKNLKNTSETSNTATVTLSGLEVGRPVLLHFHLAKNTSGARTCRAEITSGLLAGPTSGADGAASGTSTDFPYLLNVKQAKNVENTYISSCPVLATATSCAIFLYATNVYKVDFNVTITAYQW